MLLLLLACRPRGVPEPPPPSAPVVTPAQDLVGPAGGFAQGRFSDAGAAFSVAVPEEWTARIGRADEALRLELRTEDALVLRAYGWAAADCALRGLPGCTWTFTDEGAYGHIPLAGPVTVATCTPDDPRQPVHEATLVARDGRCWLFDAEIPVGMRVQAEQRLGPVLASVRLGGP